MLVLLVLAMPAWARGVDRDEVEKTVRAIQALLRQSAHDEISAQGERDGKSCQVTQKEDVELDRVSTCEIQLEQEGSFTQACTPAASGEKSEFASQWSRLVKFHLGDIERSSLKLSSHEVDTLSDFPVADKRRSFQISFSTWEGRGLINWSSNKKHGSLNDFGAPRGGSSKEEGTWNRFSFLVNDQEQGNRLLEFLGRGVELCTVKRRD
ncbi:MAG: hypothetical protein JST79_06245 [Acidobacteria bacterium]|nr:hypothetical protein [Acidobacteriota bacterium]